MARKVKSWQPSPKQIEMVNLMLDVEQKLTKNEMCEQVGVSRQTFWEWRRDEEFNGYFREQLRVLVTGEIGEVWKALICNAKRGDNPAIKLFFEMAGVYRDRKDSVVELVMRWADE